MLKWRTLELINELVLYIVSKMTEGCVGFAFTQ